MDEISEHDEERVRFAAAALLEITTARDALHPPPQGLIDRWWYADEEEIQAVLNYEQKVPYRTRLQVALLYAERCARTAGKHAAHDYYLAGLSSLVDAIWYLARDTSATPARQEAAAAATDLLLNLHRHRRGRKMRSGIKRIAPGASAGDALPEVLGLDWSHFNRCLGALRRGVRSPDAPDVLPEVERLSANVSVADLLIAELPEAEPVEVPVYDCSDQERRVASVELAGFRGSPGPMTLDLVTGNKPVSALILGDNGSGKSTVADAMEMALQGRIGRSIAFESPLGPAALSFAGVDVSEAAVTLDDGTKVHRKLTRRDDGRLALDLDAVRPGFRLAPISLKRQDILRFLDTGAMARGHVFFDYFPASASEMAVRPEEQLQRLDDEEYELRVRRTHLSEVLGQELGVDADELTAKDFLVATLRDQVLGGQTIDQAQRSGAWAELPEAIRVPAAQLLATQNRLRNIKKERQRGVETKNPVRYRTQAALLAQALEGIGDLLTVAFKEITGAEHVKRIDVVFGRSGPVALDIVIELASGVRCFPQQLFSEGYRDLLAILFFVVVAKRAAEHGQARILILDDVFQSVDAGIRSGTVDYLLREFMDWQLILTVHDRLWFEQLQLAFRRHQHKFVERELRRWRFDAGIAVVTTPGGLTTNLEHQLAHGDPAGICGAAGFLLEQASDQLSWRLGISVKRAPGDKYTLGALWPGIAKECRRTQLRPVCERIDALYSLRNLAGAHYNEWAKSLSLEEAERFGEAVLAFVRATWCPDCHEWIAKSGSAIRCTRAHLEA